MEIYKSRIQFISRKEVLVIMSVIIIPLLINKLLIPYVFPGIGGFLVFAIGAVLLFAFAYLKGFWSNKYVYLFKEGAKFRLDEAGRDGLINSFPGLKITGYGWIYEAFSNIITQDEDEDELARKKLPVGQKNSNLMAVVHLKSDKHTIYLIESLSPWRSTPNLLPYFHLTQPDKENGYYYVKGLEKLVSDLNLSII